jgi:molybdopterin molybdotransferase
MMGREKPFLPVIAATMGEDIAKAKGLTEFVRCRVVSQHGDHQVFSTGNQSSGVLSSLSLGKGLIVGPPELPLLPKGMRVHVLVLDAEQFGSEEAPF